MDKILKATLGPAKCGLDLGDGSERAEYVNQDYILQTLGRPHRNIGIMYTYYPKDKEWPERISVACKDMEIHFQWDYPYDDYFPYRGGLDGDTKGEPFNQMRDIRRHGQDVTLTLTIDCSLTDDYLRAIARDLKPFGRMRLRINHECGGDWFTHNQRFSYEEIGDFYVRFANIVKEEAPQIKLIFCGPSIDTASAEGKLSHEEAFAGALAAADIWSEDCYLALHYGWPFDVCEKGGTSYSMNPVDEFVENLKKTSDRATVVNGGECKPLVISEFNTDGDVTGPLRQGESIKRFVNKLKEQEEGWFDGFSMYQFRDRGRLGLEIEDPNNNAVGIPQPVLKDYKDILKDEFFLPALNVSEELSFPAKLRWGGSEDAEGIAIPLTFEKSPEFCEITFEETDLNLMMELNGRWFYKAPGTKTVDMMAAFFENPIEPQTELTLKIFAPPATGENDSSQGEDWDINYYSVINKLPDIRIRYESIQDVG